MLFRQQANFAAGYGNITRLEEQNGITEAFFDNGMAMEVDLKRVGINLENLQVQYDNAKAMLAQQLS